MQIGSGMLPRMPVLDHFRQLTRPQRHTFVAAFLGWTLDSLDFFILIFCVPAIAGEFHAKPSAVLGAVFLTQAFRPVGALVFGMLADRYGRRPVLMVNILSFSVIELACAFAPSLTALLVLRALFGLAMGGEWGVGAALAFETLPKEGRGTFSGILQEGYAMGSILASAAFALFFHGFALAGLAVPGIGWRGLFMLGSTPALLVFYVQARVAESPAWLAGARSIAGRLRQRRARAGSVRPNTDGFSAHVSFSGAADDGVYELFARHAGCVSDVSGSNSEIDAADDRVDRRAVWGRVDRRRVCLWDADRAMGAKARNCDGGVVGDSRDSAVCLRALGVDAGHRRGADAVYGAGRVGSGAGVSDRAFAGAGAGNGAGTGVPAWRADHVLERQGAGAGGGAMGKLSGGAGGYGDCCGADAGRAWRCVGREAKGQDMTAA